MEKFLEEISEGIPAEIPKRTYGEIPLGILGQIPEGILKKSLKQLHSVTKINYWSVSKPNLCVSDRFWAADSESGLRFAPARHNFELYLNL